MPVGHRRRRREACWTAASTAASSQQTDAKCPKPASLIRGSSPPLTPAGEGEENEKQEKGDQYEHWLTAPRQKDDVGAHRDDQADDEYRDHRKVAGVSAEFVRVVHWLADCATCNAMKPP
jgi:hypothetical protein